MSTRRKSSETDNENPSKRQRLVEMGAAPTFAACFDDLNNDCLVLIMSFLPTEDMNTIACVNHQCREARSNESLDQTRTATIICSRAKNSTDTSLQNALISASRVLTANHTRLKVVGLETLGGDAVDEELPIEPLVHVTTLELALNPTEHNRRRTLFTRAWFLFLPNYLTNVTELLLEGVRFELSSLRLFCQSLQSLVRVTWNGGHLNLDGLHFRGAESLTELVLDNCDLVFDLIAPMADNVDPLEIYRAALVFLSNDSPLSPYIMTWCQRLERLSLKGATWSIS